MMVETIVQSGVAWESGIFLVQGGHTGCGSPQLTPIPDKSTLCQVGPCVPESSDCVRLCICTPVGYQL